MSDSDQKLLRELASCATLGEEFLFQEGDDQRLLRIRDDLTILRDILQPKDNEDLVEAARRLKAFNDRRTCAFCGWATEMDEGWEKRVLDHMLSCDKHPLGPLCRFSDTLHKAIGVATNGLGALIHMPEDIAGTAARSQAEETLEAMTSILEKFTEKMEKSDDPEAK